MIDYKSISDILSNQYVAWGVSAVGILALTAVVNAYEGSNLERRNIAWLAQRLLFRRQTLKETLEEMNQ